MKKKHVIILAISAAIIIVVAVLYFHFRNKAVVYYWRSVTVERGDVSLLVTATGSMAADTSVDIGVQVSGIVARLKADFNDVVKKGQVIAVLDTTLYNAAKVDAAAALQRAITAVEQAKRDMDRSKNLLDNKVAAAADYELTLTTYQTAKGNAVSAQAQLNRAIINLRYCTVTAPMAGTIISRNVQVGNMVIASFNSPVLFTIANSLAKMQLQANVDEADIGQVKLGQHANFTVDTYPNDVFTGTVTQIRRQPTMVQNVVNYVVIIEVPNLDLRLIPGLTANVNIFIQERTNVLKVATNAFTFIPPAAYIQNATFLSDSVKHFWQDKLQKNSELRKQQIVVTDGGQGYLWIIKDKDIYPIHVNKGLNDGSFTEISGDVKENYQVATGINQTASDQTTSKASNPFIPKFPKRK